MDDLGPAASLLGMKISCHKNFLALSQERYVLEILAEYNLQTCCSVSTPMVPNTRLDLASDKEVAAFQALNISYQRAIGSLNCLSVLTWPDIAFAVSQLSQYLERPGIDHWCAFLHLLCYLSGTKHYAICVGSSDGVFCIYTNADWANCSETRQSYSSYLVTWGASIIAWKAKKQATVSTSTTEAKYCAIYDGVQQAIWLQSLMHSITGSSIYPIEIFTNNQAALALSKNLLANQCTKNIDVKFHFIREAVKKDWVNISYVSTAVIPANGLTKSLANSFLKAVHSKKIGLGGCSLQKFDIFGVEFCAPQFFWSGL
jgi:hypothetical protein